VLGYYIGAGYNEPNWIFHCNFELNHKVVNVGRLQLDVEFTYVTGRMIEACIVSARP